MITWTKMPEPGTYVGERGWAIKPHLVRTQTGNYYVSGYFVLHNGEVVATRAYLRDAKRYPQQAEVAA